MTKSEFALHQFDQGFKCSQSVLETFAKDIGIDTVLARKIAVPFAGGSGLKGECGAVTGAFMVIGLKHGIADAGDMDDFMNIMDKVAQFAEKFKAIHGTLNCHELINLDVLKEEDFIKFQKQDIKHKKCTKYVEDTVKILEEIL